MSGGQGEGSKIRKETQDDRDSLDSDHTPRATRLDNVVDEGDEDDVSNYTVFVHDKEKEAKDKETPIFKPLSSNMTESSLDDVSRYLNENPAPFLGDVGLPRNAGTPDEHGSTVVNHVMHLTPGETLILCLIPKGNPELTSCISGAYENPLNVLAKTSNFQVQPITVVDDPVPSPYTTTTTTTKPTSSQKKKYVLSAFEESISTHVINEVKNHAPTLVLDVVVDFILPYSIDVQVNNDLYNALSNSMQQNRRKARKDSCKEENLRKRYHDNQDPPKNHEGEKSEKKHKFVGVSSSGNDQVMFESKYLKSGNKDLKKKKYNLSITKRLVVKYKIRWIEEEIGIIFRDTLAEYDEHAVLGIHHWSKMKKLYNKGKRASVAKGNVYSDSRITFVKKVKVDL
ncbi:hypothetical protein Tco_0613630 [Tanacetum coccineum]